MNDPFGAFAPRSLRSSRNLTDVLVRRVTISAETDVKRDGWVGSTGLEPILYGKHSLRRTKVAMIYRRTGNLRAVPLLLGHTKLDSTVRYLGIEVDDALSISEQVDI